MTIAQRPERHSAAVDRVKIHAAEGTIRIQSQELFAVPNDQALHSLIERLFEASAVDAVALDRDRSIAEIRYDRSAMNVSTALRTFSASLLAPDPVGAPRASHAGSLLQPYLARIPGRVKLVERRRHPEGDLTSAALAEIEAASSTNGSAVGSPAVIGRRTAAPGESMVVVEDLIVEFDPAPDFGAGATSEVTPLASHVTRPWAGEVVVGGVRRMANLAAAGGCFVMSIVGVITPGIPTVPFVLATGYFLAQSSPRLHARFRRSRFFGRMVSDYEDHGGLRWSTKFKMILFTVGLLVVTVVIAGATFPLLIAVGAMGTIGIYLLGRIPTVNGESRPSAAEPAMA